MLVTVSKTAFIPLCTSPIAIGFGASAQLVSRDLLSCHRAGGGAEQQASEGGRGRKRHNERDTQPADPNAIVISYAAAGTVDS